MNFSLFTTVFLPCSSATGYCRDPYASRCTDRILLLYDCTGIQYSILHSTFTRLLLLLLDSLDLTTEAESNSNRMTRNGQFKTRQDSGLRQVPGCHTSMTRNRFHARGEQFTLLVRNRRFHAEIGAFNARPPARRLPSSHDATVDTLS